MDLTEPPRELPFLMAISWFDREPMKLSALEMLRRYEAGWRYLGVLGDLSDRERAFVRALIERFGSEIDLPSA